MKAAKPFRILVLLQVVGHPRDSKRIAMLQSAGYEVKALAFERDYHNGRIPNCPTESLGKIANQQYFKRIFKMLAVLPRIRKRMAEFDVVYALGQDVAAMGQLATLGMKKNVIMEVGDIVHLQLHPGISGKVVRCIERFFVQHYGLLVVISPGFLEEYYRARLGVTTPALVLENKLEEYLASYDFTPIPKHFAKHGKPLLDRPLRIGYFGLLRDTWSWGVLSSLAKGYPKEYEVWFAGRKIEPVDIEQQIANYPNMRYLGEYKSPQDLRKLYDSVDMVWACYAPIGEFDWNLRWGRPNRFFESCFFGRPVFARTGAHFAKDVAREGIGCCINTSQIEDVHKQIRSISTKQLEIWEANMKKLPKEMYLYTEETKWLSEAILPLVDQKKGL